MYRNYNTCITDNRIVINGVSIPPCPSDSKCITVINDRVYIDGYEWTGKRWKRTVRALWHLIF